MPDTIPNPYSSRFAPALSGLARAFMSGPSDAQNIAHAEHALTLKQKREGHERTSNNVRAIGTPGFDMRATLADAFAAGIDPSQIGTANRVYNANTYGAADPRTDNSVVGAGGGFSSTADAFKQTQAGLDRRHTETISENARQFDQKPYTYGSPTGPVIGTQKTAVGQPAVEDIGKVKGDFARNAVNQPGGLNSLTGSERTFVGANDEKVRTPHNYIAQGGQTFQTADGVTDLRTGQPLPPGMIAAVQGTPEQSGLRPNVVADLQKQDISHQRFKGLLDYTRNLAQADAANFGISGVVKGVTQDATQIAGNLAQGLGYTGLQEAVDQIRQRAIASGVSPGILSGVFDPKLPALHTASDLLIYSAAEALAGQAGRNVSDKDVHLFRGIVGDPRDWSTSQEKTLSKLDTINQVLEIQAAVNSQNLRRPPVPGGSAPAAPGASPPPSPAPGAPQSRPRATNPQTGQVVEFDGTQWAPVQ